MLPRLPQTNHFISYFIEKIWQSLAQSPTFLLQYDLMPASILSCFPLLKHVYKEAIPYTSSERFSYRFPHYFYVFSHTFRIRSSHVHLHMYMHVYLDRCEFSPCIRKIPWRREWQPTPVLLPGKSYGQKSLVGYSPQGFKELDTTEQLHFANSVGVFSLWVKTKI